MTRYFAWNWNRNEIRYVVANAQGESLKIVSAGIQPIEQPALENDPDPGNELEPKTESSRELRFEDRLEETLKSVVTSNKVSRAEVLVAVESGTYELMDFSLPPASDNELPELVAHQVSSESIGITDEARIDFLALAGSVSAAREVTAAVMPADKFRFVLDLCISANLTPKRFLIRPLATASLFFRQRKENIAPGSILVNLADNEVDLSLIDRERVLYSRTVQLPEKLSQHERIEKLAIELKRTIASAPLEKLENETVERIYFLERDDSEIDKELDYLADRLQLPIESHDPFDELEIPAERLPTESGMFPALLGMILDESSNRLPPIDFLNPKKTPKPPDRKRLYGLIAAGILIAIGYLGFTNWEKLAEVDAENAKLAAELKKINKDITQAVKKKKKVDALKAWEKKNIVWLDELRDLAVRFPSRRHLMIHRLSMAPSRSGGGVVNFNGLARDDRMIGRMEDNIRDKFHTINTPKVQRRIQKQALTWQFDSTLFVKKRTKKDYLAQNSSKKNKKSTANKKSNTVPVSTPDTKKKNNAKNKKTGKKNGGRKKNVD